MIYNIKAGIDIFELNPGLSLIPEFVTLDSRQMLLVMLVCDNSKDNPVRTLPPKERREKAARIAGYHLEADGKRLDKRGRETVNGLKITVERAIEKFKELHWDEKLRNKEALRKQIFEIREFLESEKRIPLLEKGKIVLNASGGEIYITDQKALKLAVDLGIKLPELEEALDKLEAQDQEPPQFEGTTYTASDITQAVLDSEEPLSTVDMFHQSRQQKND